MKRFILFIFLFMFGLEIFSQEMSNTSAILMKIELATPKIYNQNEDIYLDVKIINKGEFSLATLITDDKKFSFDFQIVTMKNQQLEHSRAYITSFHRVQTIFKSKISLEPNEGYSYKVRLNDYFDLTTPGQYYIKGFYYPNLKLNNDTLGSIYSNQLTINIKPSDIDEKYIVEKKDIEEEVKLFAEKRPPDEAVRYMLEARMKKEWNKYFLYLDLEKLILNNGKFNQNFLKKDSERQKEIIEQYKEYLKKDTIDDISFLPHNFEILKTEYGQGKGKVDVIIEYKYIEYIERKYYTFFLYKKGEIWYVYDYEVMNMGVK
ncbi:MAG: hypothetical protein A2086_14110 [Spirochaetes bacterium GWD1_27_9]|nr:MAG: hypothetical protein A2Z98_14380 [Spirochaetes bacterium GWB1_27_13]OHD22282.1 MAG: hypothetical protein A2Y34_06155 [Spirochaetes bacterium GWC1_27_15]OHD37778.1 MAG: hypothetical protein A2086_14110 [Spirochaetes bacterium GWD1_27_9]